MDEIIFEAHFGDEVKTAKLTNPSGSHSSVNHSLSIDNLHRATLVKMLDGWHVYFNTDEYTFGDAQVLLDMLKDKLGEYF